MTQATPTRSPRPHLLLPTVLASVLLLSACAESARLTVAQGTGPNPSLPEPASTLIPTVNIAPAKGWPAGATPVPAAGLRVAAFASGLDHPRWLLVLPNGDVLVAESNAPPKGDSADPGLLARVKGWVMGRVMQRAGAGVPSADRITLLRDTDGDGKADKEVVLYGGFTPGDTHFVANHFVMAPDGWVYASNGGGGEVFPLSNPERKVRLSSGTFRFKPDGSAIEQIASQGGNSFGNEVTSKMTKLAGGLQKQANGTWDKLETVFEQRVERALQRLGVPTHTEIAELTRRVEALTASVQKLSGSRPAASRPVARKRSTKTSARAGA